MARNIYSIYDAKARFSEIVRRVREGETVLVSYRGEPVAEIRPIGSREDSVSDRLRRLESRGVLHRGRAARDGLRGVARRPGALRRFLADRE